MAIRACPSSSTQSSKGANPAVTPFEVITGRQLSVKLKFAGDLGVRIPDDTLQRADRVIRYGKPRLLREHRGGAVLEPLAVQCAQEINQRVNVAGRNVKRANLDIEVRIADAPPSVETNDVSERLQRSVVHVRRVPRDVAQRGCLEGASIAGSARDGRAPFVGISGRHRVKAKSEIVKCAVGQVRAVVAAAAP